LKNERKRQKKIIKKKNQRAPGTSATPEMADSSRILADRMKGAEEKSSKGRG